MPSVLIIEDVEDLRMILRVYFTKFGFEVLEAPDGVEGIRLAHQKKPSLIITDLSMPYTGGDVVLGFIRSTKALKDIPVIVSSALPNSREIAERMGASACLPKPYNMEEFKAVLRQLDIIPAKP
jgi:CheY-like chemotaxis protein